MVSLLVSVHVRVRIHERVSFLTYSRWQEVLLIAEEKKREKNVLSSVERMNVYSTIPFFNSLMFCMMCTFFC